MKYANRLSDVSRKGVEYYDKNPDEFAEKLRDREPISDAHWLASRYHKKGKIVDAGCGIGVDCEFFAQQGMKVYAYDASSEMVKRSQERLSKYGVEVHYHGHHELRFKREERADAILASASLLFLDADDLKLALMAFSNALKPNGIILASFKKGPRDDRLPDGRVYHNRTDVDLAWLAEMGNLEGLAVWERQDSLGRDLAWLTFVLRKRA
jgi:2-polyprenyl-3-methyl-5-hydroxy-6-metoxy-1,4-benzoquinol methylase